MQNLTSIIIKHLAEAHRIDADTLARATANGDLAHMHHRLHEQMLAAGDIFHREGQLAGEGE